MSNESSASGNAIMSPTMNAGDRGPVPIFAFARVMRFHRIISLHAPLEHRRELSQGDSPRPVGASQGTAPAADGPRRRGALGHAGYGDDDGEDAGGVGAGRVRAVQRRTAD